MRLVDLAPKWFSRFDTGARLGVTFACPVHAHLGLDENGSAPCMLGRVYAPTEDGSTGHRWARTGEDFASMSLSPSILYRTVPEGHARAVDEAHVCDVQRCTIVHWHGFVTNGEVSVLADSVKP